MLNFKNFANKKLDDWFGINVIRTKLRPSTVVSDPRDVSLKNRESTYLANLPLESGRGLRFYSLTGNTFHPFVIAARSALLNEAHTNRFNIVYKYLHAYSKLAKVSNANDTFGLAEHPVFEDKSHPLGGVFPWDFVALKKINKAMEKFINRENLAWGFDSIVTLENAQEHDQKVIIESNRLLSVLESFEQKGYDYKTFGAIDADILCKGSEFKWAVGGGQHRAAVFSALQSDRNITARIRRIIRFEDILTWPNVRNGIYTVAAATEIFNRYFEAQPPPNVNKWESYVHKNN